MIGRRNKNNPLFFTSHKLATLSLFAAMPAMAIVEVAPGFSDPALNHVTEQLNVGYNFDNQTEFQKSIPSQADCTAFETENAVQLSNAGATINCANYVPGNADVDNNIARIENSELLLAGTESTSGSATLNIEYGYFDIDKYLNIFAPGANPTLLQEPYNMSVEFRTDVINAAEGYGVGITTTANTGVRLIDYGDTSKTDEVLFLWYDINDVDGDGEFIEYNSYPVSEIADNLTFTFTTAYDDTTGILSFSLVSSDNSVSVSDDFTPSFSIGLFAMSFSVTNDDLLIIAEPIGANVYFDNFVTDEQYTVESYSLNNSPLRLDGNDYVDNIFGLPNMPGMMFIDGFATNSDGDITPSSAALIVGDDNQVGISQLPGFDLESFFDGVTNFNIALITTVDPSSNTSTYMTLMTPESNATLDTFLAQDPNTSLVAFYADFYQAQGAGQSYTINFPSNVPAVPAEAVTTLTTVTGVNGIDNRVTNINKGVCRSVELVNSALALMVLAEQSNNETQKANRLAKANKRLNNAAVRLQKVVDGPLAKLDSKNLIPQQNADALNAWIADLQALLQHSAAEYADVAATIPVDCSSL